MNAPRHYEQTGHFYFGRAEKQQQVVLFTDAGTVSAIWDEGEAPYDDSMLPSEVSQILRERIKSFWIMTNREETLAKLDAIDARSKEFDRDFLLARSKRLQEQAAKISQQAARLRDEAAYLEQEMAEEGGAS